MFTRKKYIILYALIFLVVFILAAKIATEHNQPATTDSRNNEKNPSTVQTNSKSREPINISTITQGEFFTIEKIAPKKPIKNTTLKIALLGIIQGQSSELSSAIISSKNATSTYQVKEKIEGTNGQVSLHEIEQNRIILDNNGKLEILELFSP